jgi:hypothetical protein
MFDDMHTTLEEKKQRALNKFHDVRDREEYLRNTYGSSNLTDHKKLIEDARNETFNAWSDLIDVNSGTPEDSESGDAYTVEGPHAHITVSFNDEPVARYCIDEDGDVVIPVEELGALLDAIKDDAEKDRQRSYQEGLLRGADAPRRFRRWIKKTIPAVWNLEKLLDDLVDVTKK